MKVKDAAAATEIAMQQAKRAGLPTLFVNVVSARRQPKNNRWEVIVNYVGTKYMAKIDSDNGDVIEWGTVGS